MYMYGQLIVCNYCNSIPRSSIYMLPYILGCNGTNEANGQEIHWRKSSEKTVGDEGGPKVRSRNWWREEAAPLPTGYGCAARDQALPEVDGVADPEAAVPATGARDSARLQDGLALPVVGRDGAAGGERGLPGRPLRGHQSVRHPRKARHHHAERHPARTQNPRRARLDGHHSVHLRLSLLMN